MHATLHKTSTHASCKNTHTPVHVQNTYFTTHTFTRKQKWGVYETPMPTLRSNLQVQDHRFNYIGMADEVLTQRTHMQSLKVQCKIVQKL